MSEQQYPAYIDRGDKREEAWLRKEHRLQATIAQQQARIEALESELAIKRAAIGLAENAAKAAKFDLAAERELNQVHLIEAEQRIAELEREADSYRHVWGEAEREVTQLHNKLLNPDQEPETRDS